jgi:hypothetical protein
MKRLIVLAVALVLLAPAPALAAGQFAGGHRSAFEQLKAQVNRQAAKIKQLEREAEIATARLDWYDQCTPEAMDVGFLLDMVVGPLYPAGLWTPLGGLVIYTLALSPDCVGDVEPAQVKGLRTLKVVRP